MTAHEPLGNDTFAHRLWRFKPPIGMTTAYTGGNFLLDLLPKPELDAMRDDIEVVTLSCGQQLFPLSPGKVLESVFFPITAITSMLVTMIDGRSAETGTAGWEGIVGAQSAFGSPIILESWIDQVPGTAARMPMPAFAVHVRGLPRLRFAVQRYVQWYLAFIAQSVACNGLHPLIERSARWLLLTHDRARLEPFDLSYDLLAKMLAARQSEVTVATRTLQNAGLISYIDGRITVVDRLGLEAASCECYLVSNCDYERLLHQEPFTFEPELPGNN